MTYIPKWHISTFWKKHIFSGGLRSEKRRSQPETDTSRKLISAKLLQRHLHISWNFDHFSDVKSPNWVWVFFTQQPRWVGDIEVFKKSWKVTIQRFLGWDCEDWSNVFGTQFHLISIKETLHSIQSFQFVDFARFSRQNRTLHFQQKIRKHVRMYRRLRSPTWKVSTLKNNFHFLDCAHGC